MLTDDEIKALRDNCFEATFVVPRHFCHELATRLLNAEAELGQVRTVLASTELASLPDDYSTVTMAHNRMDRIRELTLQGLAEIGRCEALEARVKALEEAAEEFHVWEGATKRFAAMQARVTVLEDALRKIGASVGPPPRTPNDDFVSEIVHAALQEQSK